MAIKEILGEHVLAQLTNEELDVQRLASSANMQDDQIDRELRSLQAEVERFDDADKPTAKFQASVAALLDDFRAHALRLDTLCSFLSDKSAQKATDVQAAAKERAKVLDETFNKAMEATLKEQKPLEENVRSLFSFFMEAGCDGEANSVYVTNHHAVSDSYAESLGEASIRDLPLDSNTKQHPVFGMSVDEDGKTKPITIRRLNDVSVVQRMTAAIATSSDITKRSDIIFWAKNSHESNAVWFTNVSRSHVGNAPPDFTTFATTLKEIYGGVDEFHKSMVAVGNRPVVRKKSRFEADHITSHPAFALLGKHYYMQKVANRTMVQSPINPVKDALSKEWICDADGEPILECPWLRDNRSRLAESRMVFIDVISGRLADNEVLHFSSASSTWTEGSPFPYTLKLGDHFLQKIITHHLLMNKGGQVSNKEAQKVGRDLNAKLAKLSGSHDKNMFEKAWVDYEKSKCIDEVVLDGNGEQVMGADGNPILTGKKVQVHTVHVKYKQGTEDFEVHAVTS